MAAVNRLLWIAVPLALVAIVRPWTIRPLDTAKPAVFDASTFASTAWPTLVREATHTATDVATTAASGSSLGKARFVKGVGTVAGIDRQSRVGVVRVQLANAGPVVAIQLGPVIRGTALRDASSFIRFSDFMNQFEYAGAANALNDYVLRTVIAPLPIDTLQGRTISFVGAVGKSPNREDGTIEIVPVQLGISGGGSN